MTKTSRTDKICNNGNKLILLHCYVFMQNEQCLIVEPVFIPFSNEDILIGEKSVSSSFWGYCGFEFLERWA